MTTGKIGKIKQQLLRIHYTLPQEWFRISGNQQTSSIPIQLAHSPISHRMELQTPKKM